MTSLIDRANTGVQKLQPYQPGKPIEELERELGLSDIVKLASNENPLGPSPRAKEAAARALDELEIYPDGNAFALKQALSKKLSVSLDGITIGNGSNDLLELIGRAWLNPQRNAVFSAHAFAVYPLVTQAVGAEMRIAPADAGYGHDLEAMAALVDENTGVVFIANPNNPTGTWLSHDALKSFIASIPAQTIVVLDEAYFEYVDEPDYPDGVAWLAEFPNLIVTRTFSKAHGLAALRCGYSLSSAEIADVLNRVRQPFNANSVALAAATAALADVEHVNSSRTVNKIGLEQLAAGFNELGLNWIPSVANFIAVDVGRPCLPVYDAVLHEGVILRPIANYGMPNFLRVTVGLEQQNQRVLDAFTKVLIS